MTPVSAKRALTNSDDRRIQDGLKITSTEGRMSQVILNRKESERRKTEGMQLALDLSGPWQEDVMMEFRDWLAVELARGMTTITVERFRAEARSVPPSPNCWGSLPRLAIKAGLIARALNSSGEPIYRKAASERTHAHPVGVYNICSAAHLSVSEGAA